MVRARRGSAQAGGDTERARVNTVNVETTRCLISAKRPDVIFAWNLFFLDGSGRIQPNKADEFVCQSCFLVKHRRQLADEDLMLCVDCV